MTVKELRDILDQYIKNDPLDLWQLNDCELDALYYKEHCEEHRDALKKERVEKRKSSEREKLISALAEKYDEFKNIHINH